MACRRTIIPAILFLATVAFAEQSGQTESKNSAPAAPKAPVAPILRQKAVQPETREGTVVLSNKERFYGKLHLTRGKRLRVWDIERKKYREIALSELSGINIHVARKRVEREWRFKEEGSDEKVFTGRTYARLDFGLTLTLAGKKRPVKCRIARGTPIYVQPPKGKRQRFLIQPHMTGDMGQRADQLVYVKEIVFGPPKKAKMEKRNRASPDPSEEVKVEAPESPPEMAGKAKDGTEKRRENCSSAIAPKTDEKAAP